MTLDGTPTLGRTDVLILVVVDVFVKLLDEPIGASESTEQLLEDLVARGSCGELLIPWQPPGKGPRSGSFILLQRDLLSHPRFPHSPRWSAAVHLFHAHTA